MSMRCSATGDLDLLIRVNVSKYNNWYTLVKMSGSAIVEHIIKYFDMCLVFCQKFFLGRSRVPSDYHLNVLESLYMQSKQSSICKEEWLLGLNIICL